MSDSSGSTLEQSVRRMFFKWLLFSTAAIFAVALISGARATAADVFIDEGDGDFDKPTPVETPVSNAGSNTGLDLDGDFNASKGDSPDQSPVIDSAPAIVETGTTLPAANEPSVMEATAEGTSSKPIVKAKAEKTKKVVKSVSKSGSKSAVKSAKSGSKVAKAKSTKKTVVAVKSKKKSVAGKTKASGKKTTKRKVASVMKFAGGQYVSTSRECAMESAPGAGDTVGTTKAQRKLWVEDAGDAGYWKVYSKSGQAAFLSRSCF